jgi:hypothetical protein
MSDTRCPVYDKGHIYRYDGQLGMHVCECGQVKYFDDVDKSWH